MNTKRNYLLLTPGPLSTSETVREAMLQDWCTWDKDYNEGIVTPIRKGLLAIAGLDEDEYTDVLLQGSGTYCVEATIGAAVKPTDKLLILANVLTANVWHRLRNTIILTMYWSLCTRRNW